MTGRPSFGYTLLFALLAAGTTWAALMAWRGFVVNSGTYLAPLAATAVVVAAAGAVLRWLGSPTVVTVLVQVALAVAMVSGQLGGSPLPVGAAGSEIMRALSQAMDSSRTYAAPIPGDVPSVAPLMLLGGTVFVLLVDVLACTLRRVPVAGLALLGVYSVPAGLVESGPGLLAFLLASTGFLALLHLDNRDHLLRWGRPLGPDERNPWTETSAVADAMRVGAGRIGVAATACAVLLSPFIPVLDINLLGIGPGDGDDDIQIHNPRTDLRRDLERGADIPLIRVRTDDPSPEYLRVAVLNRFTGVEWSSGDRGVAGDNTATGELPPPAGLSVDVPRTSYSYEFSATDEFDSTWLPTQFPAAAVQAGGDWRYDDDTMDFLAVPEDLTTKGLDWQETGLDLDFGTTGEFFRDAGINDVDDEFLEVPGGLPSIVRSQAAAVTTGANNDYQAALLLQDWFRKSGGFRYSVAKAPPGMGGDTFDTFLSDDDPDGRIGYCEQFASAMAVMARMVGIPARVAVGFLAPDPLGDGEWEYSSHDLHAWPELYFDGAGWVGFEPTPSFRSGDAPDYTTVPVDRRDLPEQTNTTRNSAPSRSLTDEATAATTAVAPKDRGAAGSDATDDGAGWADVLLWTLAVVLVLALVGVLALAPRTLRRRTRRRRLAGTPEDVWDELRATALDLNLPWPSGRSPQEVGRVLVEHLGDRADTDRPERPHTGPDADPGAAAALERLVAALEVLRYARPGSAVPDSGLAEDAMVCAVSLEAGVTARTARRARWLPRSVWQRSARQRAERDDLVEV